MTVKHRARSLFRLVNAGVAICMLLGLTLMATAQQPTLSNKDAVVKRQVDKLSSGDKISVIRRSGPELFGTFTSEEPDGFTCYDIDANTPVHFSFTEIKKVKQGYGGYNSLRHTHTDHTKAIIAGAIVLGGILAVVLIAPSH